MKKILATTLAFVLLSTVFFVSKVPVRAAEDTTTGTFLSATRSIPERTNNVTYKTDNSNVSKTFGTALKITSGGSEAGELLFAERDPKSGGKGMLMYAKTEADGKGINWLCTDVYSRNSGTASGKVCQSEFLALL